MTSKGKHFIDMYWLELGALRERERIIKLLEQEGSSIFSLPYVIALIKGESK